MASNKTLYEKINSYKNIKESKIRDIFNTEFENQLNTKVNVELEGGCADDGYIDIENDICSLLEYKLDKDFKHNKKERSIVILQCMVYLQKIKELGKRKPSSVFIGDKNECFIIDAKYLYENYLNKYHINGSASTAHMDISNRNVLDELEFDDNLDFYKFDYFQINEKFKFIDVIKSLRNIQDETFSREVITKHNITEIYKQFENDILIKSKRKNKKSNELTVNESVNLFVQILINPNQFYVDKMNILNGHNYLNKEVKVSSNFEAFFDKYKIEEDLDKKDLTSYADRMIEDETRRRKGEFFTPQIWVDDAHKEISKYLGDDWKERYIVWDNCAGLANLTRDYKFKELYLSTLEQSDIDTINKMNYNPEAIKFQFDFLNDDDDKLPRSLRRAIDEGKEILFFINPPYATGGTMGANINNKKDAVKTKVNKYMLNDGWGDSAQQLYAQFLYKIYNFNKNNNITICIYSPPLYKTGSSFKIFREKFLNNFNLKYSMLFCANNFCNTKESWSIDFSIWKNSKSKEKDVFVSYIKNELKNKIINFRKKYLYNTDNTLSASLWAKRDKEKSKNEKTLKLKSALNIKYEIAKCPDYFIGYIINWSNNVCFNRNNIGIMSTHFSDGHGFFINNKNFYKTTSLFSSRALIKANWINNADEYFAPNENHSDWQQFVNDSIVYSLFNNKSQQSSIRQIEYNNKLWDIKNEFFWLSFNQMKELAEKYNFKDMLDDIKNHNNERFVYNKLKDIQLSEDAQKVLNMATELLIKSFEKRKEEHYLNEEYYLDSWDAGYAQLKLVWEKYFQTEFNEFREMYKQFENRLIPLVYELGFLRK